MPRVVTAAGEPLDFCHHCFPKNEATARRLYAGRGEGPDDRGDCFAHEAAHPDYEGENYRCRKCKSALGEMDN
jgi:hypothetical protein